MATQYRYDEKKKTWVKVTTSTPSRGETNRNGRSSASKSSTSAKTTPAPSKSTTPSSSAPKPTPKTTTGTSSSSRTYSRGETNRSTTTSTPRYNTYDPKSKTYSYDSKNSTTGYKAIKYAPGYKHTQERDALSALQKTWDDWMEFVKGRGTEESKEQRGSLARAGMKDLDTIDTDARRKEVDEVVWQPGAKGNMDFTKFQAGKDAYKTKLWSDNIANGIDSVEGLSAREKRKAVEAARREAKEAGNTYAIAQARDGDFAAMNDLTGKAWTDAGRAGRMWGYDTTSEVMQQQVPEEMRKAGTTPVDIPAGYDMHSLDADRFMYLFKEKIDGGTATDQEWQEAKQRLEMVLGIEDADDVEDWSAISLDQDYLKDMQTLNRGTETYQDVLDKTSQYNNSKVAEDVLVLRDYFEGHVPRSTDEVQRAANRIYAATGVDVLNAESFEAAFDQAVQTNDGLREAVAQAVYKETGKMPVGADYDMDDYLTFVQSNMQVQNNANRAAAEQARFDDQIQQKYGEYLNAPDFASKSQPVSLGRAPANEAEAIHQAIVAIDDPELFEQLVDPRTGMPSAAQQKYTADTISPEQRNMYHYIRSEFGEEAAMEYLDDIDWSVRKAIAWKTEEVSKQLSEGVDEEAAAAFASGTAGTKDTSGWSFGDLGKGAVASLASILSAPARAAVVPFNTIRMAMGEDIDQYDQTFNVGRANDAIRGNVGQNLDELLNGANIAGWNIGSGVYQGLMSVADNWMLYGLGPNAGSAIMGMEAGDTAMRNALANGRSQEEALRDAYVTAGIEGITEKIGMDKLFGDVGNPLKYVVSNALAEAGEEVSSEIMNMIYDTAMYGDDSDLGRLRAKLITKGYLKGDLNWQLIKQVAGQLRDAGFGGFIGGAGGATPNATVTAISDASAGKNLQKNEAAQSLLDFAGKMLPEGDVRNMASELMGAIKEGGKVANSKLGRVYRELLGYVDEHTRQVLDGTMARNVREQLREMGVDAGKMGLEIGELTDSILRIVAGDGSAHPIDYITVGANDAAHAVAKSLTDKIDYAKGLMEKAGEFVENAGKKKPAPEAAAEGERVFNPDAEEGETESSSEEFDFYADEADADIEFEGMNLSDSEVSTTSDGEEVSVDGVESVGTDGEMKFKVTTADGTQKTVSASEVSLGTADQDTARLAAYAKEYGTDAASMFNARMPSQDVKEYAAAFGKAVQYGRDGRNIDSVSGYDSVKMLNPNQLGIAYEIGRAERSMRTEMTRQHVTEKMTANGPVKVGMVDVSQIKSVRGLNKHQRRSIVAMRNVAELLGINIEFTESAVDERGRYQGAHGSWNPSTLTLSLDIHAGSDYANDLNYAMMHTAGHELTHTIYQFADAEIRDAYQDFVLSALGNKMTEDKLEARIQEYIGKPGVKNREAAIEEIVAEASVEAFSKITESDIRQLAEENYPLVKRIANQITRWVSNMKRKIAKAFAGTEAKNEYAKMMNDQLDELAEKWNAALVNAARNKNTQQWAAERNQTEFGGERVFKADDASEATSDAASEFDFFADDAENASAEKTDGEPLVYSHIDQRTPESVRSTDTSLFCSEVEEAQIGFAAAANMLLYDAENSVSGQKFFTGDGEVTGQKRMTSGLLGRIKDTTGWTWDKIINSLRQFAAMETGDTMPKNTVTNREMELYLDEVLSKGYTTLDGQKVSPWSEYIEAKNGYQGGDGTTAPQSAYDGAIDFAEYAFAGEFEDDVKYSVRQANGKDVVWIEDNVLSAKPAEATISDHIVDYLTEHVGEVYKIIESGQSVYLGRDLPKEYAWSRYSQRIRSRNSQLYKAKARMAAGVGEAINTATNRRWEKTKHPQNKDAKRGVYKYDAKIAFPVVDTAGKIANVEAYDVTLVIRNASDGRKYLYDVQNIKKDATTASTLYSKSRGVGKNANQLRGIFSANSIAENNDGVKFSMRDPQTETPEFQKWFKGSKIVNEDGSPKIMYHGTSSYGFDSFDTYGGRYGLMGMGSYFTDNAEVAEGYTKKGRGSNPGVYEVYLSVKNPIDMDAKAGSKLARAWEEYFNEYLLSDSKINGDMTNEQILRVVEEALRYDGSMTVSEVAELFDGFYRSQGFDGITHIGGGRFGADNGVRHRVVIAFEPEQVKSATDNIGTFDPEDVNIYHQLRDPDRVSDRELLANMMDSAAENQVELDFVRRYRSKIAELDQKQAEYEQARQDVADARKSGARKSDIAVLENKAKILGNQLDRMDGQLLKFEVGKPLQAVVKRQREELRKKAGERMQKRVAEVRRQEREKYDRLDARMEELRQKKNAKIEELKREKAQKVEEMRDRKNESFARQKYLAEVKAGTDKLREMVTTPTNKKHVPEILRKPMAEFLDAFDFASKRQLEGGEPTKADRRIADAYDAMRKAIERMQKHQSGVETTGAEYFSGYLDLPNSYIEEFDNIMVKVRAAIEASGRISDTPIHQMNSKDLHELAKLLRILHSSINKMNKTLANAKYATADALAEDSMTDLDEVKMGKERIKLFGKMVDFIDWKNATPYYAFERFGRGGKAIFESLMDGWDKLAFNAQKLVEFTESVYTPKEVSEWESEIKDVKLSSGETVRMSAAQVMGVYCLAKRAQAVGHLMGGGIRVSDIEGKRGKVISQTDNYTIYEEDIEVMRGLLTDRQREVADKLQEHMSTQGSEWGNEVSMKRFGYRMFTEPHYYPIESDKNNMQEKDEEVRENSLLRLLNMSATKDLTPNATNAIVIRSIFDVYTSHMSDMAKYNALGLQILDAMKWLNYVERTEEVGKNGEKTGKIKTRSVRKSLENAYGAEARRYIVSFIRNLNGDVEAGLEDGIFNKMTSNYKIAAVGANLRVGMLQITSMPRAATVIDPKYLMMGLAKWNARKGETSKQAIEKVGIAKWKSMGFYDTNISRNLRQMIKHDETAIDKVREGSMKLAEWGDAWVMGVLYGAVESELLHTEKKLAPGTEAWDKRVNERMREIIYRTQVVDSTMTRSHLMRQKGAISGALAFMSEPTLALNMLNDAMFKVRMDARRGVKWNPATAKNVAKVMAVTATVNVFSAVIEALFSALRDDDEFEEFSEKYLTALLGDYSDAETLGDRMSAFASSSFGSKLNLLDNIPVVSDIIDAAKSGAAEQMWQAFAGEIGEGCRAVMKVVREGGSLADYYRAVYKLMGGASKAVGLPISNAMRDVVSIYNTFVAEPMGWRRLQTYDNSNSEAAAALLEAQIAGDNTKIEKARERIGVYNMDQEKIAQALAKRAEDAYAKGQIDRTTAAEFMTGDGGKRKRDAEKTLTYTDYLIETGLKHSDMKDDFISGVLTEAKAREYLKKYDGLRKDDIDDRILEWKYEQKTGLSYSSMKQDYLDGELTDSEVMSYRTQYGGAEKADVEETLGHWQYEKDTGLLWSELKDDYADGVISETKLRDYLKVYGGKDEEEVEEKVSNYDFQIATGRTSTAPKYWRIAHARETGGDYRAYVDEAFQKIMYGGEKRKTQKQARSQIASSLASYYKYYYLPIAGTAEGNAMLERILDVYEAIGYSRSYEREYIAENWFE